MNLDMVDKSQWSHHRGPVGQAVPMATANASWVLGRVPGPLNQPFGKEQGHKMPEDQYTVEFPCLSPQRDVCRIKSRLSGMHHV